MTGHDAGDGEDRRLMTDGDAGSAAAVATAAAGGLAALGAEAAGRRQAYGQDALIACDRLVRIYAADGIEQQALQGLDLLVADGELTAIVGASGSGKSTLLNILAGLDQPTAGSARVAGYDLGAMTSQQRLTYRRAVVGFIWQQTSRNLLPYLTARQNIMLPMKFAGVPRRDRLPRARQLLSVLKVGYCADRKPGQMSGGEQQRVAIATALANRPRLLLADEPTGELDRASAAAVFGALRSANTELDVTVVLVTHDAEAAGEVRRVVSIRDGRTAAETLHELGAGEDGELTRRTVEYAVLDRAGRLQLPREMIEPLGMRDRVRLTAATDHIGVWPDAPMPQPGPPSGAGQPGEGQA
jgi:ABC-type lipoprotein export system ATPase subunit